MLLTLLAPAIVCAVALTRLWVLKAAVAPPTFGWAGTEQASWIAGILGSVVALAAFVYDRIDARKEDHSRISTNDKLIQVGRIPQQAAWFQERTAGTDLAAAAKAGRTAVLTQVVSGLGGVGKTQLAAQFARQLAKTRQIELLIWVTAFGRESIIAAYAEAAVALRLADADLGLEPAAGRLLGWLERTRCRWLVVLDNLDSPSDVAGWWPPPNRHGRTVVTTRRRDAVFRTDRRAPVEVQSFTRREATDYLFRATGSDPAERVEVGLLAADLGCLPLAIAQAAAFIRDQGISCADYRQRLAGQNQPLSRLLPNDDALPDEYRSTVAATWTLSIAAADSYPPHGLARRLLLIASLLDPNGIPDSVFTADASLRFFAHDGPVPGITVREVTDALKNLHRLSLVNYDVRLGIVRVHALVQRVSRDLRTPQELASAAQTAADALLSIWPEFDRQRDFVQTLRTNIVVLQSKADQALFHEAVHPVLFRATQSLGEAGQMVAAVGWLDQLHDDSRKILGPDHPDTLSLRNNAAWWIGLAGDPAKAATLYEALLSDRLRVLGASHINTLATRHNLALAQGDAGDPGGAVGALELLLPDYMRVLGADHVDTLNTRKTLAEMKGEAGDSRGSIGEFEKLVADERRVLGADHPRTLNARENLALTRSEAGDTACAVAELEVLLTDLERILGSEHNDTLQARHNLAVARAEGGDATRAKAELKLLVTEQRRILGTDHPLTLASQKYLRALG